MHNEMLPEVKALFDLIYPNDPVTVKRLCYKTNTQNHLVTMLAKDSGEFIGQANAFVKEINGSINNIGFHVHPLFRSRGVATALVEAVVKKATDLGHTKFHIITKASNMAAIRVSRKLNFTVETDFEILQNIVFNKIIF
ncbi:MAG: GNAT family N-acetyltransferase [Desulfocapsaceae bacterium]|nr:GNAT family N-acetyltransferase [Desulfocapsaceae bacterium]